MTVPPIAPPGQAPAPLLRRILLQGKYESLAMLRNACSAGEPGASE